MKPSYRIAELERIGDAFRQRAIEAERERDEAIAAHRKHAASLIADRGLLRERAEAAERERDEFRALAEDQSELAGRNAARAQKAEGEIARRDAAAGDAADRIVDDGCGQQIGGVCVSDRLNCVWPIGTKFYTSAPPDVLPPPLDNWHNSASGVMQELQFKGDELSFTAGANWMRQKCLELGAQPQNPVVIPDLPHDCDRTEAHFKYIAALDAAGVKYKVVK